MHLKLPLTILAISAAAAVALGADAGPAAAAAEPIQPHQRPVILLVHGRGYVGLDTSLLRRDWQRALDAGAGRLGVRSPLRDGDVQLVWYADALDPMSQERCTARGSRTHGRADSQDDGLRAVLGVAGGFLTLFADGAAREDAVNLRSLAADLQFLGDRQKQCAAEQRVGNAVARAAQAGRPVILVAHSLGSIVTWGHLQHADLQPGVKAPEIHRFVTIGSPVASPVVRRLLLGDDRPTLALPARVRSWVNVVDEADPFSIPLGAGITGMADLIKRAMPGEDPHHVESYLSHPAAAAAVLGAWCDAFRGRKPGQCERLEQRQH